MITTNRIGKTLINAIWWLEYDNHGDGSITLLSYYRDDKQKGNIYGWNDRSKRFVFTETDKRVVTHVTMRAQTLKVRNPKHIFDYPRGGGNNERRKV